METAELRDGVHSYIDKADERFLRMVDAMRREYEGSDIVGYTVDGNPITQEDLKKRVRAASERAEDSVDAARYVKKSLAELPISLGHFPEKYSREQPASFQDT